MNAPLIQRTARFREEREADWLRLERIVDRVERRSVRALSDEDLFALPLLYRATISALSVARATSLDKALLDYLEALCLRAYFVVYGTRTDLGRRFAQFIVHDWPQAIRALWRETLTALAFLLVGALAGYLLVAADPRWFSAIIPQGLAEGRGPDSSAAALQSVLVTGEKDKNLLSFFAAFLFTNNAQVAILSFALGFAFGLPTAMLIAYNGCTTGAMLEIYVAHGLGPQMGGWLAIHGTTELFAIVLAGAAGFHIGRCVAFPGRDTRVVAAAKAGKVAAAAMVGVVIMLSVAGLLEGIGRQTIMSEGARYAIGLAMLALWLGFFYIPRRPGHG